MIRTLAIWTLLLSSTELWAGGIKGIIRSDDGNPLAFATIYVKQTGSGAVSDPNGNYEISLAPGSYDLIYHYLGYESFAKTVEIGSDFIRLDVTLKTQVIQLQTVTIKSNKEDPAYTIMRKAIAKAKYHTQQIDQYTAKVYIKGKGQLKDYPWIAKKALEKEGITKDRVFINESVSEIKYTRPNKFEEKVIAVYTNGNNRNTSPNAYVFGSIYEPEIAETITPLSPKSFSYYRFEYLGTFQDRGYAISKIKVIPRSPGDNVFDGIINIVEDYWSVHSLELNVTKLGIRFRVKGIYDPIEAKATPPNPSGQAWLPVSQQFFVEGKVFGFEFEANYLATVKDYVIKLNPALPQEMTVIDEKVEKEQAKVVEKKFSKKGQALQQRLEAGKDVTRKELNQLVKEYEKAEREEMKEPEVMEERNYKVDSLAYKKDSTFWSEMRPVALTKEEVRGYHVNDSVSEAQRRRQEGDSLKPARKAGFQPWDLLLGDRFRISDTQDFQIHMPMGGYNTVEGWNLIYRLSYTKRWVKRDSLNKDAPSRVSRLRISPIARYAFSRQTLSGILRVEFRNPKRRINLEGGKYVQQYNSDEPIHPMVNTFTTLFLEDNLMKLYERNYIDLKWREQINDRFAVYGQWTWARREELSNNSGYRLFDNKEKAFTPNQPYNVELFSTSFQPNQAFTTTLGIEAVPWQKYRKRNGRRSRIEHSSPRFTLEYRGGFDALGSDVRFDQIELGWKQKVKVGIRGTLDLHWRAGTFLNSDRIYFMDYKHFLGNQTPFVTTDPVGSFRLLEYYTYSTRDKYFSANVHYHFRKFLVTRIPKVRMLGVSESFFVNYLATPSSNNYVELGYGLNGILRLFRLEFAGSFSQGTYMNNGFRIGISSNISVMFDD